MWPYGAFRWKLPKRWLCPDKAIALAASIEMLHTATLIHDDIVDEADLRRGQPNIRSQFGNVVSVYAGDGSCQSDGFVPVLLWSKL